ncbi:MAG: hypothetical protein PHE94_06905, partial [Eubacteriales bacterium]|nr:hypothetical protein [Eubacteriales bacterium]
MIYKVRGGGVKRIITIIIIFSLCIFFGISYGNSGNTEVNVAQVDKPAESQQAAQGGNDTTDQDYAADKKDKKEEIDLNLKPNEAGRIMILMYHNIGDEEREWVRTPANFLKDLKVLYEKGYRPVSLTDYVRGNISTEQGMTPVVITFDDGNLNNFEYLENSQTRKDSAIGLLM